MLLSASLLSPKGLISIDFLRGTHLTSFERSYLFIPFSVQPLTPATGGQGHRLGGPGATAGQHIGGHRLGGWGRPPGGWHTVRAAPLPSSCKRGDGDVVVQTVAGRSYSAASGAGARAASTATYVSLAGDTQKLAAQGRERRASAILPTPQSGAG